MTALVLLRQDEEFLEPTLHRKKVFHHGCPQRVARRRRRHKSCIQTLPIIKKSMATVIVTGATGLLGRQVSKTFRRAVWQVHAVGYTRAEPPEVLKLDLNSEEEVSKLLRSIRPQTIVHCL
ncbi:hypothetical protein K3495_g13756 [Podosphaera aphanis]|nr:hypothetical protein K3495_g13756 [Podosphaera aphanis]